MNEIEISNFSYEDISIDVFVSVIDNTVWLSLNDMCTLFKRDKSRISRHIKTIIEDYSTKFDSTVAESATIWKEIERAGTNGRRYRINHYNLDVVNEVAFRIKSKIIVPFNNWCGQILNEYRKKTMIESNIIRFEDKDIALDVAVAPEENTVYLSKDQLIVLFDTSRQNLEYHIHNIYITNEQDKLATCKEILQVQIENGRNVTRQVEYFNLQMIISIGYRINNKRGITFRQWASRVLEQYLNKGYVINEKRALVTNDNYLCLVNKVISIDQRLQKIEQKQKYILGSDKIIFEDSMFESIVFMNNLVKKATISIVLIDPYVDILTLDVFKNKNNRVSLLVICSSKSRLSQNEIDVFNASYGGLSIKNNDKNHDRYLIIDDLLFYHIGSSINYLGRRFTQITLIEDEDIIDVLKRRIK